MFEMIYMPMAQAPRPFLLTQMTYIVRSQPHTADLTPVFRQAIRALDPNLPLTRMAPLDSLIAFSVSEPRFRTMLFGAFAATALLLVATGVFGVLAFSVTRRTREIGLRMALGAVPGTVTRLIMREMLGFTVVGVAIGLAGAVAGARLIRTMLFGIEPTDPVAFATTALFLLVLSAAASYLPARRAARVDPLTALRHD
jgi:putative ABC transport system permease protein